MGLKNSVSVRLVCLQGCRAADYDASSTPAKTHVRPSTGLYPCVLEQNTEALADWRKPCDITLANNRAAVVSAIKNDYTPAVMVRLISDRYKTQIQRYTLFRYVSKATISQQVPEMFSIFLCNVITSFTIKLLSSLSDFPFRVIQVLINC